MPRYTVTVQYPLTAYCTQDIEVEAESPEQAAESALNTANTDTFFWDGSVETDSCCGDNEVYCVRDANGAEVLSGWQAASSGPSADVLTEARALVARLKTMAVHSSHYEALERLL